MPLPRTQLTLAITTCLLGTWIGSWTRAETKVNLVRAAATISADELQRHVEVLADDQFEGREAGTRGGSAAGVYIMKALSNLKLKPAGDADGYFQDFRSGRNILAVLPGSDPKLKDEFVIVGGHYDHVGYGSRSNSFGPFGYVHNGADDNASGVACVLELAEAFCQLEQPPRRSILFAFWDGEEKGLIGSQHFVRNPSVPFEKIAFAFNVDMIGHLRDENLEVFGVRSSTGLRRIISEQNVDDGLKLTFSWELKANSDHHSFFAYGIPTIMFHTGLHDRYHRPSDDADTVNKDGMERVSRLLFRSALSVAEQPVRWQFRQEARVETESHRESFEAPSQPQASRLGLAWRRLDSGYAEVTHVEGPAAKAGIIVGDVLTAYNGDELPPDDALRLKILYAEEQVGWSLVRGDESARDLSVPLNGAAVRIGFSWRADKADSSLASVTTVRTGSAAELSGIATGDRIMAVNGEPFAGSNDLMQKLIKLPAPIQLMLENRGRVRRVNLDPLPARAEAVEAIASE